jgi:signal transduction histidine kinase
MKIATGGAPAHTADIRWHLEVIRHELRTPLGVLDLAEGHAEAAGDPQLADAVANLTHRLVETLDACERAVEALDALEAIAR